MSSHTARHSSIAGNFAHKGAALGNMPSAPFWMQLALVALRYARKHIERAEERAPRSTGCASDHIIRAIRELEAVFPRGGRERFEAKEAEDLVHAEAE